MATKTAAAPKKEYQIKDKPVGSLSVEDVAKKKANDAALAQANQTLAMTLLEDDGSNIVEQLADENEFQRRGMPTLIKPDFIPVGGVLVAVIMEIMKSPTTTVKGFLLRLKNAKGVEFCFPCTGVIRNALCPGTFDDQDKLKLELDKEVGKQLILKRQADKPSKILNDDKTPKKMFVFDVFTREV